MWQGEQVFSETTLDDAQSAETISTYVSRRAGEIGSTLNIVKANVQKAQVGQKRNFDLRRGKEIGASPPGPKEVGDFVRIKPPEKHLRKLSKHSLYGRQKLFQVVKISPTHVRVRDKSGLTWDEHLNQVQLYVPGQPESDDSEEEKEKK